MASVMVGSVTAAALLLVFILGAMLYTVGGFLVLGLVAFCLGVLVAAIDFASGKRE